MNVEQNIPDWNKDGVWQNVENELRQKKKKRFLYWWLINSASIVLLISFFKCFNTVELTNTSSNKNSNAEIEQKISPKNIPNNVPADKPIASNQYSKLESSLDTTPTNLNTKIPQSNHIKSIITSISSKELLEQITYLSPENSFENTKEPPPYPTNPPLELVKKIESTSTIPKKLNALDSLTMLAVDLSVVHSNSQDSVSTQNFNFPPSLHHPQKTVSTFWWLENGLSIGKKSFINLNRQTIARDTTEQFRFVHNNAIGVQRFLNKNWSIKLGFAYQTIYEKYEYAPSLTEEEPIFSEEAIAYELSNGVTYFDSGWTTLKTTKTRHIIHNNFIHRLSLPIELTYSFKINNWSLEPSLGLRFQYFQRFDGIIAQEGDHFFDLKTINATYYSNHFNTGLMTALNLKYNIFQQGAIGLRLTYEKDGFLNLVNSDFFSRYETVGLQVGYYHGF